MKSQDIFSYSRKKANEHGTSVEDAADRVYKSSWWWQAAVDAEPG